MHTGTCISEVLKHKVLNQRGIPGFSLLLHTASPFISHSETVPVAFMVYMSLSAQKPLSSDFMYFFSGWNQETSYSTNHFSCVHHTQGCKITARRRFSWQEDSEHLDSQEQNNVKNTSNHSRKCGKD